MRVLLGVTGGIAAYKAASLVREFIKAGCEVRVVMSHSAKDFITPLTLATLSKNPVFCEGFSPEDGRWNSHISLGEWADVMVIAPATANTIAKMRGGVADNLLLCTYLSARCEVVVAPAMDLDMWAHAATQENLDILKGRGVRVIEPSDGFLASGLVGKGRMAEPETIAQQVLLPYQKKDFKGKRVLVTAGATVEKIDAVRYISNFSTGKMGRAIAAEFESRGAEVILFGGGMSAQELLEAAQSEFERCDIAVFAAAVADYTPQQVSQSKIKSEKDGEGITLKLVPTADIARTLSSKKRSDQITVGFALESDNERENALKKLTNKNLDAIVLNSLRDEGAGFGGDTNKITIFDRDGATDFELKSKTEVAHDIVEYIYSKGDF
ncbi:MAG: bifunctional phosphopantothenoylcysteine decarboxylase/phosphopantothenate--cysteine ligase CoaBC [Rikenellaceae bacterium]